MELSTPKVATNHNSYQLLSGATDGDVAVFLGTGFLYKVDATVLKKSSSWFYDKLIFMESDLIVAAPLERVGACFILPEKGAPILERISKKEALDLLNLKASSPARTSDVMVSSSSSSSNIKTELHAMEELMELGTNPDPQQRLYTRHGYLFLLHAMHNSQPMQHKKGFQHTLAVVKCAVDLATRYDCIEILRSNVANCLHQGRQELFIEIKKDPTRFFKLAIAIQDQSIMTETLIHIIGCWPAWNWKVSKEKLMKLACGREALHLVKSKAKQMHELCFGVDRDLFLNTLNYGVGFDEHPITIGDQKESWLIVQFFRDWLACTLAEVKDEETGNLDPTRVGQIYRLLHAGGDAYLPLWQVYEKLDALGIGYDHKEVANDLMLLKNYNKEIVQPLCKNNLMLDIEENRIGYLTCIDIREDDMPWRLKAEVVSSKSEWLSHQMEIEGT